MTRLLDAGINKSEAFRIAEFVRKGRGEKLPKELIRLMLSHNISKELIDDMKTRGICFPGHMSQNIF